MDLHTAVRRPTPAAARPNPLCVLMPIEAGPLSVDPLEEDDAGDDVVVTTRRGLCRLALVATETAGRFEREGLGHDPMSWMLSPRRLYDGRAPLDACLEREACVRGVLVHGLSLGLDVDAAAVDELLNDDDDGDDGDGAAPVRPEPGSSARGRRQRSDQRLDPVSDRFGHGRPSAAGRPASRERLFTATVVACDGCETVQVFHASLAVDEAEIAGRLYMRMGAAAAGAVIVEGVDAGAPLVAALVAPAILDTLTLVAADPGSALAAGLDLNVEQRFLA